MATLRTVSVIIPIGHNDSADRVKTTFTGADEIIEEKEGSIAQAKNTGGLRAKGDWVCFADCDMDLMNMDLKQVVEEAEKNGLDLYTAYYNTDILTDYPKIWIQNTGAALGIATGFLGGFMLMKRNVFDELNGFQDIYMEDIDFALRALLNGFKIGVLPYSVKHTRPFKDWVSKFLEEKVLNMQKQYK